MSQEQTLLDKNELPADIENYSEEQLLAYLDRLDQQVEARTNHIKELEIKYEEALKVAREETVAVVEEKKETPVAAPATVATEPEKPKLFEKKGFQPFPEPDTETLKEIQAAQKNKKSRVTPLTFSLISKEDKETTAKLEALQAYTTEGKKELGLPDIQEEQPTQETETPSETPVIVETPIIEVAPEPIVIEQKTEPITKEEPAQTEELTATEILEQEKTHPETKKRAPKSLLNRAKQLVRVHSYLGKKKAGENLAVLGEVSKEMAEEYAAATRNTRAALKKGATLAVGGLAMTAVLSQMPHNHKHKKEQPKKAAEAPKTRGQNERPALFDTGTFLSEEFQKALEDAKLHPERYLDSLLKNEPQVEMPETYGDLEKHMDMKFFNEVVKKDSAFVLKYLQWAEESDNLNGSHGFASDYQIFGSKTQSMNYIINREGKPEAVFKGYFGRDKSDDIRLNSTGAGEFKLKLETDQEILSSFSVGNHSGKVINVIGNGSAAIHDTVNFAEKDAKNTDEKAHFLDLSTQQAEALKSDIAYARRGTNGCMRWPGLTQGLFDKWINADPLPKLVVLPEKTIPGKIGVIGPVDNDGIATVIYLTPEQYREAIKAIIARHTKKQSL